MLLDHKQKIPINPINDNRVSAFHRTTSQSPKFPDDNGHVYRWYLYILTCTVGEETYPQEIQNPNPQKTWSGSFFQGWTPICSVLLCFVSFVFYLTKDIIPTIRSCRSGTQLSFYRQDIQTWRSTMENCLAILSSSYMYMYSFIYLFH